MLADPSDITPVDIVGEMKTSYLDYAMSVIVARALPDVRDGLKPVHRRILFSASESGFVHNKPYRKSARIVGDVIGKYHPHGDTSIYEALARMTQDWGDAVAADRRSGQFRIDGPRYAGSDALHRGAPRASSAERTAGRTLTRTPSISTPNYDGS